jgi:hypothetical protein
MTLDRFTQRAQRVLQVARDYAKDRYYARVQPEHILLAILDDTTNPAVAALRTLTNVDTLRVETVRMADYRRQSPTSIATATFDDPETSAVLSAALQRSAAADVGDLLFALASASNPNSVPYRLLSFRALNQANIQTALTRTAHLTTPPVVAAPQPVSRPSIFATPTAPTSASVSVTSAPAAATAPQAAPTAGACCGGGCDGDLRRKWYEVVDRAIALSKSRKLSVSVCMFMEMTKAASLLSDEERASIRQDALREAANALTGSAR